MAFTNPNYNMNYMGVGTGDPMSMGLMNSNLYQPQMMQAGGAGGLISGNNPLLASIGTLGSLWGGLSQAGAQNSSASLAQQYANATSQLNPFSAYGPGGFGGSMQGGNLNLNFGGFNPTYGGLSNLSNAGVGTAGGISAPTGLNSALGGAFNSASGALGGFNPLGAGLAGNSALSASSSLANQAAGGYGANELAQYNALQQMQQFGNTNSANILQNTIFGNGQLGSSSGANAARGFSQGLATQNAADAAQAAQLGISALGTSGYTAGMLGNTGGGLLNNAFGNFANTSMLAPSVTGAYLNPALNAIGGAGNLNTQGLGLYNAGLQTSLGQNQASARAGSLATTNANSPNQQSPYGQFLGSMFGSLGAATGGLGGILGNGQGGTGLVNQLSQMFGGGNNLLATNPFTGNFSSGLMTGPGGSAMSPGNIASAYSGVNSGLAGQDMSSLLSSFGDNGAGAAAQGALDNYSLGSDVSSFFGGFSPAGGGAAGAAAGADTAANGIDTMALAQNGYASLGGVPGSLAATDTSAGASGASSGAAGLSSLAIPLAVLGATYWAGGRGTNVNTSGLMSALQAGPNGNPGYAGDVLEASSLAGNWGGAQGGYGGLNVDASGLGNWLSQNGYGTQLGNVNPNTPWSSNPFRSLTT